jgi:sulfite reductase alpha subunit-like flavoprotein
MSPSSLPLHCYACASWQVIDIENYKAERRLPKERLVLFLMATYGDGEPTDNAADFYCWISSEAEAVENGEKEPFLEVGASCRAKAAPARLAL